MAKDALDLLRVRSTESKSKFKSLHRTNHNKKSVNFCILSQLKRIKV